MDAGYHPGGVGDIELAPLADRVSAMTPVRWCWAHDNQYLDPTNGPVGRAGARLGISGAAAPGGALRAIFEQDSLRFQFVPNLVSASVVLVLLGLNSLCDQSLDVLSAQSAAAVTLKPIFWIVLQQAHREAPTLLSPGPSRPRRTTCSGLMQQRANGQRPLAY